MRGEAVMAKNKPIKKNKKKRHVPIPVKCLIALLILVLICGIIFTVYMKQQTDPDRIADQYVSVYMSKDASALFHFLGIKETSFLNAESFSRSLEECHKYSSITTYGLTKYSDPATPDQVQYNIEYRYGAHSSPYTQTLTLKNTEPPLYLFFDNWKIDYSEYIARNCSVQIPAGSTVLIDDVALTEKQITSQTGQLATYECGDLFIGTHKITVSLEGFEDYSTSVYVGNSDYKDRPLYTITPSMLRITKDTENKLIKQTEKMIQALYTGALQEDPFSRLHEKYPFEENMRPDLEKKYDTLIHNHIQSSTHLSGVEFTDFSSSCTTAYAEDRCYAMKITTSADYTSTGSVMNGGVSHEKSTTGNSLFITTVHYQGGEWFFHDSTALESCVYYLKY